MKKDFAIYWIAFKILLQKGNKLLFLIDSDQHFLDLPGGRADNNEGKVPLLKILQREIREELGKRVKYRIGEPIFQYRRYNKRKKIYNLITVYKGKYVSGPIKLSFEHDSYQWLDPKKYKFKREEFHTQEEYQAHVEYFNK